MSLPRNLPLPLMTSQWAQQLDPVVASPIIQGQMVSANLINGTTIVNHGLGRKLQGWFIVGINAAATIYDNQDSNKTPQQTLSLTSNAACAVTLWVF